MKPIARRIMFSPCQKDFTHRKIDSQVKTAWLIRFGWICVIAPFALTGCDKVKQIGLHRNASATASSYASTESTASAANPSTEHTQMQPTSVAYPIEEWQQQTLVNKANIRDVDAVKSLLGQPITIDNESLDYRSNVASKYSFAKVGEPYFNLLDSPMYMELQWYYANAHDNATIKNISVNHAKKAFQLTQHWFGQDGSEIVAKMVQGQPIKNSTYHGILVELARCENYHCDLVVRKPTVTKKTNKKRG